MSVQASAINEFNGQLVFTEVRAVDLKSAQERAAKVAKAFGRSGKQVVGIAYDVAEGVRRVRLNDDTELSWEQFLASKGLKDEGYAVEPSEVRS